MKEADSIHGDWAAPAGREGADQPNSSTTPIVWSVNVAGKNVFDISHVDLVERVRDGRLPVTSFLWRDGMEDWKALDEFPEFEVLVAEAKAHDSGLRSKPEEATPTSTAMVSSPPTPTHIGLGVPDAAVPRDALDDGNEVTTVFGVLAVYERQAPTLEFSAAAEENARDEDPPASDQLTPIQTPRKRLAVPRPAKSDPPPPPRPMQRKSEPPPLPPQIAQRKSEPPSLPPLPALRKAADKSPAPVSSTPAEPKVAPGAPGREAEVLAADDVSAAPAPAPPLPTPAIPDDVPPPPSSVVGPPRPALASLPPIIVRESVPPGELVATPAPVQLDESTLVLGRRKIHRWVPLRAAIFSAFGAACLASVLTWLIVRPVRALRAQAAQPRATAAAPAPAPEPASTSTTREPAAEEPQAAVDSAAGEPAPAAAETAAAKPSGEASPSERKPASSRARSTAAAKADPWRRDSSDPGLTESAKSEDAKSAEAPSTARAGWPSNPGF